MKRNDIHSNNTDSTRLQDLRRVKLTDSSQVFLTAEQAAQFGLAKSANAVRILVHRGRIRAYKPNGRLLLKLTDVLVFIENTVINRST